MKVIYTALIILLHAGLLKADNGNLSTHAVKTDIAPVIDGRIEEDVWQKAQPITDFKQREPIEGADATERTEARILYDDKNMYFAMKMWDSDPSQIMSTILQREGQINQDDFIMVALDTYHDKRNSYIFQLNSFGTQGDALVSEQGDPDWNWEGIYYSEGRVTADGWEVEFSVPFTTLRFTESDTMEMGIAFFRSIRRKNEDVLWPHIPLNFRGGIYQPSEYATLTGLKNIKQGNNLQIKPYGLAGMQKQPSAPEAKTTLTKAGLDVKYGVTSNLTLDLTLNTDFAQVEADNVQINLGRFNLFFPEKREFFLERAGIFNFGDTQRLTPFFSRRIGIENDILAGARMTGQVGPATVGFLNIQTQSNDDVKGSNYTVARVTSQVLPRTTLGGIATNVQSVNGVYNRVACADAAVRFWENALASVWFGNVWSSEKLQSTAAGQMYVNLSSDLIRAEAAYSNVGKNFDPGIGFVERADINSYYTEFGIAPRFKGNGFVRQVSTVAGTVYIENQSHEKQSHYMWANTNIRFESGDGMDGGVSYNFEHLTEDFEIRRGAIIPAGDYPFTKANLWIGSNQGRMISAWIDGSAGGFYNGKRQSMGVGTTIKFSENLIVSANLNQNFIDLPVTNGKFTTRIGTGRLTYYFSRNLSIASLLQYDNVSENLRANIRLNWMHTPGSNLFLVFNTSYIMDDDGLSLRERNLTNRTGVVKLTYLFGV
ncbi:MAG: DUF5916 domain-containing protein [Bacteroidota bacterium]